MPSALTLYKSGAVITAVFIAAAIGADFKSEHDAEKKIAVVNSPVMKRFAECQDGCSRDMGPFLTCIKTKADDVMGKIYPITKERESDRAFIRSLIVLGLAGFSFFGLMVREERKILARLPQPHSESPHSPA